jgi:carboxymethylenebutenolidase
VAPAIFHRAGGGTAISGDFERVDQLFGLDVPTKVLRYAAAEHGFHNGSRPTYNAPAATDAWDRTLDWLATHLA